MQVEQVKANSIPIKLGVGATWSHLDILLAAFLLQTMSSTQFQDVSFDIIVDHHFHFIFLNTLIYFHFVFLLLRLNFCMLIFNHLLKIKFSKQVRDVCTLTSIVSINAPMYSLQYTMVTTHSFEILICIQSLNDCFGYYHSQLIQLIYNS